MAELKKPWSDGGTAYEGGDGSAVFTSDANESLDREMEVSFVDGGRQIIVTRKVTQVGLREVFNCSDGLFRLSNGGTQSKLVGLSPMRRPLTLSNGQHINRPWCRRYIIKARLMYSPKRINSFLAPTIAKQCGYPSTTIRHTLVGVESTTNCLANHCGAQRICYIRRYRNNDAV